MSHTQHFSTPHQTSCGLRNGLADLFQETEDIELSIEEMERQAVSWVAEQSVRKLSHVNPTTVKAAPFWDICTSNHVAPSLLCQVYICSAHLLLQMQIMSLSDMFPGAREKLQVRIRKHSSILLHTHTHVHIHTRTHVHTHVHTDMYTYTHTYTHTYIHMYTHTHTHNTHTYTHLCSAWNRRVWTICQVVWTNFLMTKTMKQPSHKW